MPETIADLGRRVKVKYPGFYEHLSDAELGSRVKTKYPSDYGHFVDIPKIPGMEKLGGWAPGVPLPQPVTPEMQSERDPASGREYDPTFRQDYGIMTTPMRGVYGVVRGVERAADPVQTIMGDIGQSQLATMGKKPAPPATTTTEGGTTRELAGATHDIASGAMEASTPFLAATGVTAPVKTAVALGTGMVAQHSIAEGLKELGLPPEYADVVGDLAGLVTGALGLKAAERVKLKGLLEFRWKAAGKGAIKDALSEAVSPKTWGEAGLSELEHRLTPITGLPPVVGPTLAMLRIGKGAVRGALREGTRAEVPAVAETVPPVQPETPSPAAAEEYYTEQGDRYAPPAEAPPAAAPEPEPAPPPAVQRPAPASVPAEPPYQHGTLADRLKGLSPNAKRQILEHRARREGGMSPAAQAILDSLPPVEAPPPVATPQLNDLVAAPSAAGTPTLADLTTGYPSFGNGWADLSPHNDLGLQRKAPNIPHGQLYIFEHPDGTTIEFQRVGQQGRESVGQWTPDEVRQWREAAAMRQTKAGQRKTLQYEIQNRVAERILGEAAPAPPPAAPPTNLETLAATPQGAPPPVATSKLDELVAAARGVMGKKAAAPATGAQPPAESVKPGGLAALAGEEAPVTPATGTVADLSQQLIEKGGFEPAATAVVKDQPLSPKAEAYAQQLHKEGVKANLAADTVDDHGFWANANALMKQNGKDVGAITSIQERGKIVDRIRELEQSAPTAPHYVYHGTSSKVIDSIEKNGAISPSTAGSSIHRAGNPQTQRGVYVADNPVSAMTFAHSAAELQGGHPVVFRINGSDVGKNLRRDSEMPRYGYIHEGDIPINAIDQAFSVNDKGDVSDLLREHGALPKGSAAGR